MVETPDLASAAAAAGKLCTALAAFGDPMVLEIERYWKIERYFHAVIPCCKSATRTMPCGA